jgi:ankyrin repeat protein
MGKWMKLRQSEILDLNALANRIAGGTDVNMEVETAADSLHGGSIYPLGVAASNGNVEACRMLLEAGADPCLRSADGSPVFGMVIDARNLLTKVEKDSGQRKFPARRMEAIFKLLVQYGATPNGKKDIRILDADESPIFQAAWRGDHEAVAALAKLGANLYVTCNMAAYPSYLKGFDSPLSIALKKGHNEVVLALLKNGMNEAAVWSTGNYAGMTLFQASVAAGLNRVVEYYVRERGEDLAQRSSTGRTLLQLAKTDETRQLLKALKTQMAIQGAVDGQLGGGPVVAAAKKRKGLAPL